MPTHADAAMTMSLGTSHANLHVVTQPDEERWRTFVEEHPHGNVFHTPEMFRVFERTQGHRPEAWAVVDGSSEILVLMTPVRINLRSGPLERLTTRAVSYGSVLCRGSEEARAALGLLLTTYAEAVNRRSLFTELRNLHDVSDLRPVLESCGYVHEDHLNFLVALDLPVEEIQSRIARSTRQAIRKGLRDGNVSITEVCHRDELAAWYRVLEQTYRNARIPLADLSLFEAAFDILRPLGMVRFVLARVDDAVVACSAELAYKDTVYGWYGGSDRRYNRYVPNDLLTWHILEWAATSGYRVYDFGGAGKPGEDYGVRNFKAKFGGGLVGFGRFTQVHAPIRLRVSTAGFHVLRRFL